MKKRFTEVQINGFPREALLAYRSRSCAVRAVSAEPPTSYSALWRSKFSGMRVPHAKRVEELEGENTRLKNLLAEQMLENEVIKDVQKKP